MSKRKLLALLMVALMAVTMLAACGGGDDENNNGDGGDATGTAGEIVVLVPNADHGWTGAVLNYAKEKADEINDAGGDVSVRVLAATDAKNQQEQIDDLLGAATAPVGIVILPYDNTMESSMANVAATDIPFIMFDRIIDNPVVQEEVVANVKGDNEGIGYATAERFIEQGLEPGDKLYVMIGDTSSVPIMRNDGFEQGLKDNGWTDEQIAEIEYSAQTNWSRSEGKQIFIDWVNNKTVDQLADYKYIFTHDDEIGMGILEALAGTEIEESKKNAFMESVVSIGSSSGLNEMYNVLKGEHSNDAYPDIVANFDLFSVTYDPAMIQTAIDDMVQHLSGGNVNKDHTIEVHVVDATNVNEYQGF